MTEVERTIAQQRLIIWCLVAVIFVLLVLLHFAHEKLREKDLDGKLARGRRKQSRMEQHPKRTATIDVPQKFSFYFEDMDGNRKQMTPGTQVVLIPSDENGGPT